MMMTVPTLHEAITQKEAEIKNYERILREYQSGRWLDMGRRRLETLRTEYQALRQWLPPEASPTVSSPSP